jgi:hypothetical protein
VFDSFNAFVAKELADANRSLQQKKLGEIHPLTRSQWDASSGDSGPPGGAGSHMFWDRD